MVVVGNAAATIIEIYINDYNRVVIPAKAGMTETVLNAVTDFVILTNLTVSKESCHYDRVFIRGVSNHVQTGEF